MPDRLPGRWNIPTPVAASGGTTVSIPQMQHQETLANLANGATRSFFFNTDYLPMCDVFIFADRIIDVSFLIRQGTTDTYRQLNGAVFASGVANQLRAVVLGQRLPGSMIEVRLENNSGAATTTLSAQVHMRSF